MTTNFEPNYDRECICCGGVPCVDIVDTGEGKKEVTELELCGVCCWGSAECLDPENW